LIATGAAFLLSMLLGVIDLPQTPGARRMAAERRWAARPFSAYQVALRVEYWNRVCFQEVEIHGERVQKILSDTCQASSFSSLTVTRLFDISERIEQAPTCYPDARPCACRLMRIGTIDYDAQLGYPRKIIYRREVQPNWSHPDFWRRLADRRELPSCGQARSLRIVVVSFAPLP
jgi:hypothetical protein